MGLRTLDLKTGCAVGFTGGTSLEFVEDGVTIPNGIHMSCSTDNVYLERKQLTAKVRPPVLDPKTRKFGKGKHSISVAVPIQIDQGVVYNTARVEFEIHPGFDTTALNDLRAIVCQAVGHPDMDNYWRVGGFN